MSPHPPIIALSARRTSERSYVEDRDAVARDWWPFLKAALPGFVPLILPNDEEYAGKLCGLPGLRGLVLTGGNDIGSCPDRDRAEESACKAMRGRGLPVLGICRGLQFLVHLHGGRTEPGDPAAHRATRHWVEVLDPLYGPSREVNSYHDIRAFPAESGLLRAVAHAPDGSVEALRHLHEPLHAVCWHPERERIPDPHDLELFRRIFDPADGNRPLPESP